VHFKYLIHFINGQSDFVNNLGTFQSPFGICDMTFLVSVLFIEASYSICTGVRDDRGLLVGRSYILSDRSSLDSLPRSYTFHPRE
jgi:hypothetical protein